MVLASAHRNQRTSPDLFFKIANAVRMAVKRELVDISSFIDKLNELPLNERQFAIRLAERIHRVPQYKEH